MRRIKTKIQGVRYREHASRKHGLLLDRYFIIRYRVDGKEKEEGLGWASEGWTLAKAADTLAELKMNARTGTGEKTLGEKREAAEAAKQAKLDRLRAEQEAVEIELQENVPLSVFWHGVTLQWMQRNIKMLTEDLKKKPEINIDKAGGMNQIKNNRPATPILIMSDAHPGG